MDAHDSPHASPRQRARFAAVRRKVFGEMEASTSRWRLYWVIPFNVGVLVLLVWGGECPARAACHSAGCVLTMAAFAMPFQPGKAMQTLQKVLSLLGLFLTLGATGGVTSPLLMMSVPYLMGTSLASFHKGHKIAVYLTITFGFIMLALLGHTEIGRLAEPLTPVDGHPSVAYIAISACTFVMSAVATGFMGKGISIGYERVALELAARREELCSESEDRTRALEGIAARLAHEVKNPLAAIKGLSTHMARSATDPKAAERLSIVAEEAERLQAIVDGFLSFSRGLDDLKVSRVVPHTLSRELVLLLETRAAETGISLEVTGDASIEVEADGRKLRQALLNFVLNAMQASTPGSVVTIDVERKTEAGCPLLDGVRMRVIDRGAGMSPEVLDRIRKPYFTTREGGSGLGVAVARGLVEQHGGLVCYESTLGRGTTVTLELPRISTFADALPNPCRPAVERSSTASSAASHPMGDAALTRA